MSNTQDNGISRWTGLNGFEALHAWEPTFKHHHLPMWAKKRVRQFAIECDEWCAGVTQHEGLLPGYVFDHWGSILRGNVRVLYAMPYHRPDELAEIWAGVMDCTVESFAPSPWFKGTTCYIFTPIVKP